MPRSVGYRATKENREEISALRARLHACKSSEWQKAGLIMQRIAQTLGHSGGPMGARIQPRACRYCHFYGHTKQWCPKRITDEAAALQREIDADKRWRSRRAGGEVDPQWLEWNEWADRRFKAARDAGHGCEEIVAESAADYKAVRACKCRGCSGWDAFVTDWEARNPEPPHWRPHTSERGACT